MERDPLLRYTREECSNMPHEQFEALLESHNEYVRNKYRMLTEQEGVDAKCDFNSIEELQEYFNCQPLQNALNDISKLFGS